MKFSILSKMALDNIAKRRHIYLPYLMAVSLMMSLQYIMLSLIHNQYVRTRHSSLIDLVMAAAFFSIILALIFILYANNFMIKQRRQEFALYRLLGLENKHLRYLIGIEQVLTSVIVSIAALAIGYVFGHLMFALVNRMMQDTGATLMDYPFDWTACLSLLVIIALIFTCLWINNSLRVVMIAPAELLNQRKAGEKEPKSRWMLLLIGLVATGYGYYLALTIQGVIDAIFIFLLAVACVILGTFALMVSCSIIILKALRKRKAYYYRPKPFLTISGLIYRMKANGVSLALLTVLCTGVILTLGTTLTLFLGLDSLTQNMIPRDYEISLVDETGTYASQTMDQVKPLLEAAISPYETSQVVYHRDLFMPVIIDQDHFVSYKEATGQETINSYGYVIAMSLSDFNAIHQRQDVLAEDEILLATNDLRFTQVDQMSLAGDLVKIKPISDDLLPTNLIGHKFLMVVPDDHQLEKIRQAYPSGRNGQINPVAYQHAVAFNVVDKTMTPHQVEALLDKSLPVELKSKDAIIHEMYAIDGGFLFLGIIVGTVLIIGIVLMLYFKQLSEGLDDQAKYRTMKQVGLPNQLVKSTIRQQVIWIFSLPLIIAVIHALMAHRLMFNLLGGFGIEYFSLFIKGYGGVLLIFIGVYFVMYKLTAHIYYQMIKQV